MWGWRLGGLVVGCHLIRTEGACHAPGMLMHQADMHGQESWEWPVHKALWAHPRR